ncbi:hypothetical protein C8J56DRAFT_1177165 [Mycena floridula]|nr:hypothetical protein C8J56DRAFT_1177165 [Mycena floridula]
MPSSGNGKSQRKSRRKGSKAFPQGFQNKMGQDGLHGVHNYGDGSWGQARHTPTGPSAGCMSEFHLNNTSEPPNCPAMSRSTRKMVQDARRPRRTEHSPAPPIATTPSSPYLGSQSAPASMSRQISPSMLYPDHSPSALSAPSPSSYLSPSPRHEWAPGSQSSLSPLSAHSPMLCLNGPPSPSYPHSGLAADNYTTGSMDYLQPELSLLFQELPNELPHLSMDQFRQMDRGLSLSPLNLSTPSPSGTNAAINSPSSTNFDESTFDFDNFGENYTSSSPYSAPPPMTPSPSSTYGFLPYVDPDLGDPSAMYNSLGHSSNVSHSPNIYVGGGGASPSGASYPSASYNHPMSLFSHHHSPLSNSSHLPYSTSNPPGISSAEQSTALFNPSMDPPWTCSPSGPLQPNPPSLSGSLHHTPSSYNSNYYTDKPCLQNPQFLSPSNSYPYPPHH